MEISHRVETLSHFVQRIRRGETPRRLTWPVLVVDDATGRVVTRAERERILRELGVELSLEHEPDVYDFADALD